MEEFKTTCKLNRKTFNEVRYLLIPRLSKLILIISSILLAALSVVQFLIGASYFHIALSWLYIIIFSSVFIWTGSRIAKVQEQRLIETTGSASIEVTTTFTDEGVRIFNHSTKVDVVIPYVKIKRFAESANFYTFVTEGQQCIFTNKNVIKDTYDERAFFEYLKFKCPGLKKALKH
jgi:hypothetical protein